MGFEKLAALKAELARQREGSRRPAERRSDARRPAKEATAPQGKAKSQDEGQHRQGKAPARDKAVHGGTKPGGVGTGAGKPQRKARREPAAARRTEEPVDPTVRNIWKLQKQFPLAFPKAPAAKLPLKIGIYDDLLPHAAALQMTEQELRDALKQWCRGSRYWACLAEGAPRIDLAGAEAGQVSARDAARARHLEQLRSRRAKPSSPAPAQASPADATEGTPPVADGERTDPA
ncbi:MULTISPECIES: ProQ/FinO family protein [Cupriavidus]|uniref:ProQ/FinO family protein n=1 Tax=Cupriavidus TaxID=106589 RepID=UPI0007E345F1|nr:MULTISPECIES: ProQ/FinO family protein [Cupriavidus]MCD9120579.1 ProQ/FinO family protein [Cupriavidus sp. UGS-1]MCT9070235.1 ProQ/FinO family protein [Cupriavidus gilardii]QKS61354.1 ProQ/FinO family protein [Cupriavidus gilardii]